MPESETDHKTDFLHPSFKAKCVYHLECVFCMEKLCSRGMKAILLADTATEMYSTDAPIQFAVDTVGDSYRTGYCFCKVKDVACVHCGNVVGYHVCTPCRQCLLSCNNGHYWMFYSDTVYPLQRLGQSGEEIQKWGSLQSAKEEEESLHNFEFMEECLR